MEVMARTAEDGDVVQQRRGRICLSRGVRRGDVTGISGLRAGVALNAVDRLNPRSDFLVGCEGLGGAAAEVGIVFVVDPDFHLREGF
jgi:hypothetical protein